MRKVCDADPLMRDERGTHHTRNSGDDVDRLSNPLTGAPPSTHAIMAMQRNVGNAAVARLFDGRRASPPPTSTVRKSDASVVTQSEVQTFQLEAKIPIGKPSPTISAPPLVPHAHADEEPGQEQSDELQQIEAILGMSARPTSPTAPVERLVPGDKAPTEDLVPGNTRIEPAAGSRSEGQSPFRVPDITITDFENVDLCDAISPWLTYSGTISQGGAPPRGFGVTRPGSMTVRNITVTKIPVAGWWLVSSTVTQEIKWQVRASVGPSGQANIASAVSSGITGANWSTVASDLTPNMSDLNGRPPRTKFWAKDLTERHELFHANDAKTRAPAALNAASAWLGTQQAHSVADVNALLAQVPGRVVAAVTAGMAMPGREERAYGDGADAYSRRATAIKALGNVGFYP